MEKCSKKDCVDFDVSKEDIDLVGNCSMCERNRKNPTFVTNDDQYLKMEGKVANPTDDVPVGFNFNSPTFTPIPTMKDRRGPEQVFIEEAAEITEGTFDRCNTGLDQKKDNFNVFAKLINNQFQHGGQKYALKGDKEFTDAICEAFPGASGVDWVLGTCMKYLGRYKNFGREKDLLKIATYMYLLWLKGGYHLNTTHDEDTKKEG